MLILTVLLSGIVLLYLGGDWLLEGVSDLGSRWNWPKAITGLILVSLGTSAPELFVSIGSSVQGHGAMAAGNVFGSNIINSAIVLGLAICACKMVVEKVMQRQLVITAVLSLIAAILIHDGLLTRLEGLLLIGVATASLIAAVMHTGKVSATAAADAPDSSEQASSKQASPARATQLRSSQQSLALLTGGIIALLLGAEALIWSGVKLAQQLGVSQAVIALTVTALGTSLPEIAATIAAVKKRETSMAIGNVVGSNLLNLGLVLGLSATIRPLTNTDISSFTLTVFLCLTVFVTVVGTKPGYYPRWTGYLLLAGYALYTTALVQTT